MATPEKDLERIGHRVVAVTDVHRSEAFEASAARVGADRRS